MKNSRFILATIFVCFSTLYFCSARLIVSSNDGSQFALTSAIALENRFQIQTYFGYTRNWDFAYRNGNFYSDRPVGLSLLAAPLLQAAVLTDKILSAPDTDQRAKLWVVLLPAMLGAVSVMLILQTLRNLGFSVATAVLVSCSYGLASLNWKYAALFMSHGPASTLVMYLVFRLSQPHSSSTKWSLSTYGFCLGLLPLLRYELTLLMPVFLLSAWHRTRTNKSPPSFKELTAALLATALPVALLAFYHSVCFGRPWLTFAEFYAPNRNFWKQSLDLNQGGGFTVTNMMSGDIVTGIKVILFGSTYLNNPHGYLYLQPLLWLAFPGALLLVRRNLHFGVTIGLLCAVMIFAAAKTLSVDGGAMRDARYCLPILPLAYLALATVLEKNSQFKTSPIGISIFCCFSAWSFYRCAVHFTESDGSAHLPVYGLDALAPALFVNSSNFSSGLLSSLGVLLAWRLGCVVSAWSIWSSSKFKTLVIVALLSANLALGYGCFYATLHGVNRFNFFSDTLRIGDVPAKLAVQETNRTFLNNQVYSAPALASFGELCTDAIVVKPRSVTSFISPTSPVRFQATAVSTNFAEGKDLPGLATFEIWSGKELLWSSKTATPRVVDSNNLPNNHAFEIDLSIGASTEIELRTEIDPVTARPILAWCGPKFAS